MISLKTPSLFKWITSAPTLIGKINRLINSAKAKDWLTTAATSIALLAYLGSFVGLPVDNHIVEALNIVALSVVGCFTGRKVADIPEDTPRKPLTHCHLSPHRG